MKPLEARTRLAECAQILAAGQPLPPILRAWMVRALHCRIRQLAYYDTLTRLPNRTMFNECAEQALHAMRGHQGLVFFLDLDRFKLWNDSLGHAAGDALLREIADRLRTCKPAPLQQPGAGPFIAIHMQLITRKSLGGLRTDLRSRVLDAAGAPIPGLYCVGEAAGFGGGGACGKRSLEGTFLPGCILTARAAARSIATGA